MHYIDIDWAPSAITIAGAVSAIVALRFAAWLGKRRADARTRRSIERALSARDGEEAGSKHA